MRTSCATTHSKKNIEMVGEIERFHLMLIKRILVAFVMCLNIGSVQVDAAQISDDLFPCYSSWSADYENNGLLSLHIDCEGQKKYFGYTFSYYGGNVIVSTTWLDKKVEFIALGETCAFAVFVDSYSTPFGNADVVLCQNNDDLFMMKIRSDRANNIPDYARFIRTGSPS